MTNTRFIALVAGLVLTLHGVAEAKHVRMVWQDDAGAVVGANTNDGHVFLQVGDELVRIVVNDDGSLGEYGVDTYYTSPDCTGTPMYGAYSYIGTREAVAKLPGDHVFYFGSGPGTEQGFGSFVRAADLSWQNDADCAAAFAGFAPAVYVAPNSCCITYSGTGNLSATQGTVDLSRYALPLHAALR